MGYALAQLQHTANYIVERCQYENHDKLTASTKRRLSNDLVRVLLELAAKNKPLMVIEPNNQALKAFFDMLIEDKIQFPDATYIIKQGTECYARCNQDKSQKTVIYDHRRRHEFGYKDEVKDLRKALRALTIEEGQGDTVDIANEALTAKSSKPLRFTQSQSQPRHPSAVAAADLDCATSHGAFSLRTAKL